ncbi:MAG: hypothetical protein HQL81_15950 [Magnetococcales bacterium]|nr:hypothetical protein [Magnetococcales bacterium]
MGVGKIVKKARDFLGKRWKKQKKKIEEFENILNRLSEKETKVLMRLHRETDPRKVKEMKKKLQLIRVNKVEGIKLCERVNEVRKK